MEKSEVELINDYIKTREKHRVELNLLKLQQSKNNIEKEQKKNVAEHENKLQNAELLVVNSTDESHRKEVKKKFIRQLCILIASINKSNLDKISFSQGLNTCNILVRLVNDLNYFLKDKNISPRISEILPPLDDNDELDSKNFVAFLEEKRGILNSKKSFNCIELLKFISDF